MSSPNENQGNGEPPPKKPMLDLDGAFNASPSTSGANNNELHTNDLISRISKVLSCSICSVVPQISIYQCQRGHLMCGACVSHLMADANLRDVISKCLTCRVKISEETVHRNFAAEIIVSELPGRCGYCENEFPFKSLQYHKENECIERPSKCSYYPIGCKWRGPCYMKPDHERNCPELQKTPQDITKYLMANKESDFQEDLKTAECFYDLLGYENITFNDLKLKSCRTNESVHRLFYQTDRFLAFNHDWVVKASINHGQRNLHQFNERVITYQLQLKTVIDEPLSVYFAVMKGPYLDIQLQTRICNHEFTALSLESDSFVLPIKNDLGFDEYNRLLASNGVHFRFFMFTRMPVSQIGDNYDNLFSESSSF